MGRHVNCLLVAAAGIIILTISSRRVSGFNHETPRIIQQLYEMLGNSTEENVIVSPISVATTEAMKRFVQREAVKKVEDQEILQPDPDYSRFLQEIQKRDAKFRLEIANRLFPAWESQLSPALIATLKSVFLADSIPLNYTEPEEAANVINTFVSSATHETVTQVVAPEDLKNTTTLLAVSAVYFNGTWEKRFSRANTITADFFLQDNSTISTDMMRLRDTLRYGEIPELDAVCVALPYQSGHWTAYFLLPNQMLSLPQMEKRLASYSLRDIVRHLRMQEVDLRLPKFSLETNSVINGSFLEQNPLAPYYDYQYRFAYTWQTDEEGGFYGGSTAFFTGVEKALELEESVTEGVPIFNANRPFHAILAPAHRDQFLYPLFIARIGNPSY